MARKPKDGSLNERQQLFCKYYVETCNATQAAIKAGYSEKTASVTGCQLLMNHKVAQEIGHLMDKRQKSAIMSAEEVMQHFTAIARGEEKDQFGLDISASDRIKALVEIAKRTVDVENRANGVADHKVEIVVDWSREDEDRDTEPTEDNRGTDQEE